MDQQGLTVLGPRELTVEHLSEDGVSRTTEVEVERVVGL